MNYPNLDAEKSGLRLKFLTRSEGYSVTDLQNYLHLSCPQPIYRWFRGETFPSIHHLYALSKLLHINMNDLLVEDGESAFANVDMLKSCFSSNRVSRPKIKYVLYCGDSIMDYEIERAENRYIIERCKRYAELLGGKYLA